jgi:hypothetical protein
MDKDVMKMINFDEGSYEEKLEKVTKGFTHLESVMEGFALGLTKQLNETHT